MENEENVLDQDSNGQEEEVLETSNDGGNDEKDSIDWEAKATKAEELANNYKIRAEKAEKLAKAVKSGEAPKQTPTTAGEMSSKDLYALMDAKVALEDIDEVREYASLKKISISEALSSNVVKSILSDKSEQRRVSSASNVGGSKRTTNKSADSTLLENFKKGIAPDNDEDFARLVALRTAR